MKAVDRWLQSWRIAKARPFIPPGGRVLDVGCADGALFRQLGAQIGDGLGLDPDLGAPVEGPGYRLLPGTFPESVEKEEPFDVITMLAVLEHVLPEEQEVMARGCATHLNRGGHLVVTTPSPLVDPILDVLATLRVIDGMSLDQHYGFEPRHTLDVFTGHGLTLVRSARFQLGLNNLFVFRRDPDESR